MMVRALGAERAWEIWMLRGRRGILRDWERNVCRMSLLDGVVWVGVDGERGLRRCIVVVEVDSRSVDDWRSGMVLEW